MSSKYNSSLRGEFMTSRRKFVGLAGLGLAGLLTACGDVTNTPASSSSTPAPSATTAAVVTTAAAASSATTAAAGASGKMPTIGLIMKSLANDYFKDMQAGATKYQQDKGTFKLMPVGIQNETDIDAQVALVENMITQKVDAIVIAPADSRGLVSVLAKAVKAGIKVVNIDVKLDDGALQQAGIDLAFVGPDNAAASKLSGDALAKKLGSGAKVVILEGNPGADNATQRKNGFVASVKEGNLNLLDSRTAHWETEEANTVFTNMLTAHPDIQGVMCSNDSMALGVVKAIGSANQTGKIQVASFDNIAAVQALIKQDKVLATVDQYGSQQANFGIDNALKLLNGEKITGWIKTPVKLITKVDLS